MGEGVFVLHTGGTIGMVATPEGHATVAGALGPYLDWIVANSGGELAPISFHELDPPIDSANATPDDWCTIARTLFERREDHPGFVVTARAEDGYNLWLRYAPVEDAALRGAYRQAIAGVVVQGSPATAAIVSRELARGLEGLLGAAVPAWTTVTGDGALVVGTLASPLVSALGWGGELTELGAEGFLIRPARIGGRRALVVASASPVLAEGFPNVYMTR